MSTDNISEKPLANELIPFDENVQKKSLSASFNDHASPKKTNQDRSAEAIESSKQNTYGGLKVSKSFITNYKFVKKMNALPVKNLVLVRLDSVNDKCVLNNKFASRVRLVDKNEVPSLPGYELPPIKLVQLNESIQERKIDGIVFDSFAIVNENSTLSGLKLDNSILVNNELCCNKSIGILMPELAYSCI